MDIDARQLLLDGRGALLGSWGVVVVKAPSAIEATQVISESDIDVLLAGSDLGDGINGMEVLRRLRSSKDATLTAVLITAYHSPEVAPIARAAS